jgi:uncharacterized membrane protein
MQVAGPILALVILGLIVGAAINFTTGILAIPLILVFIGGVIGKEQMERQQRILRMKRFRRDARARPQDFTREDKRTVV